MLCVLLIMYLNVLVNSETSRTKLSRVDGNAWWGPRGRKVDDKIVVPFTIKFEDDVIKDLVCRLKNTRQLTPPLNNIGFQYGVNTNELKKWIHFWAHKYNFVKREAFLNKYPQYVTYIQGLRIHFIRIIPNAPENKTRIPVLVMHGWPGSVRILYDILPLITAVADDRDFVLEVVAPSLPGFAFSDGAVYPGMGIAEVAVIMKNLMFRLGYYKFLVQGGDWGGLIGSYMATMFQKIVIGYHTNFGVAINNEALAIIAAGSMNPALIMNPAYEDRIYPLNKTFSIILREFGYLHEQSTKPDTLGVALSDSPAGLLTWFLQLFSSDTSRAFYNRTDGGLNTYTKDQILDNTMLYWITNSITTSIRLYAETFNTRTLDEGIYKIPTKVPTYIIQAKYEVIYIPPAALRTKYLNLVNVSVWDHGGHFLPLELPEEYADGVLKGIGEILQFRKHNNMQ